MMMKTENENHWNVKSLYEFQFFNCPTCPFKNYSKQDFVNHAFDAHPKSKYYLMKISNDNSFDDIQIPPPDNNIVEKLRIENFQEVIDQTIDIKYELDDYRECLKEKTITDCHEQLDLIDDPLGTYELSNVKTEEIDLNDIDDLNCYSVKPADSEKLPKKPKPKSVIKKQKGKRKKMVKRNIQAEPMSNIPEDNSINSNIDLFEQDSGADILSSEGEKNYAVTPDKIFECDTCQEKYSTSRALSSHKKREKHYLCITCNKTFSTGDSLWSHKTNVHVRVKKHICDVCGKSYSLPTQLKQHKNSVHDGIKDLICTTCGKSYSLVRSLRKHIRSSHETKSIVCESCGKAFSLPELLKTHIKMVRSIVLNFMHISMPFPSYMHILAFSLQVHEGQRNHKCDICDSKFYAKGDLQRHIDAVHLKKPDVWKRQNKWTWKKTY